MSLPGTPEELCPSTPGVPLWNGLRQPRGTWACTPSFQSVLRKIGHYLLAHLGSVQGHYLFAHLGSVQGLAQDALTLTR